MALKQYREAARTASVIAREEQNAGQTHSLTAVVLNRRQVTGRHDFELKIWTYVQQNLKFTQRWRRGAVV